MNAGIDVPDERVAQVSPGGSSQVGHPAAAQTTAGCPTCGRPALPGRRGRPVQRGCPIPGGADAASVTDDRCCPGGCRVTRGRGRGAFRTSCGTVSGSTLRPGGPGHQGDPGCWSRPSLTASWPSLLLLVTGFNSIVALPDVVLTATGRATLLSKRTADSNREGHDAHAAPAAPGRGTAHLRPETEITRRGTSSKISRGKPSDDRQELDSPRS